MGHHLDDIIEQGLAETHRLDDLTRIASVIIQAHEAAIAELQARVAIESRVIAENTARRAAVQAKVAQAEADKALSAG